MVLADLAPLALQKKIELELLNEETTSQHLITLEVDSLEIVLQNLVTNALRHSTSGSSIQVRWLFDSTTSLLEVIDHGEGVTEQQKPLLLQRFHRQGDSCGAGLGLAIVARIIERHNGQLNLVDTAGGGLTLSIAFKH